MSLLLDVVTTAGVLFAVAMGLLVVFGVLKIINFAHGAFLTLGAYAALVTTQWRVSPWLAYGTFAQVPGVPQRSAMMTRRWPKPGMVVINE